MTGPLFQSPDQPPASAKRDRTNPATSTGECTHCGGQNLPMCGRRIDRHHPRRVKGRHLGVPLIRVATEDGWCPGSLHPAAEGTVEKTPDTAPATAPAGTRRPYRGNAMPAARRDQILRRDGAA